jgi:hypothetical protein
MSFEIQKEPHVHGSAEQQLLLQIEHLKRTVKSPYELIEHVIKLYGAEFIKANAALDEQRRANDELFRIKQKVVIANRGLVQDNAELRARLGLLPVVTDALREAHARLNNELAITAEKDSGFANDLLALLEFFERYDEARHKQQDVADIEAHKRKAEDTPA